MSAVEDKRPLDILLSNDLLRDVGVEGRSFERQIWQADTSPAVTVSKISLEKAEGDLYRLRVTVVGKEPEPKPASSATTTQTTQSPRYTLGVQTKPEVGKGTGQQTDVKPTSEIHMQTDEKVVREIELQTDPPAVKEKFIQAIVQSKTGHMQTEHLGQHIHVQTDLVVKESQTQTIIKQFSNATVQAKAPIKAVHVQTTRDYMQNVSAETEPMIVIDPEDQCENDSQTDPMRVIDPRLERALAVQTDACKVIYPQNMSEVDCQTDVVRVTDPALDRDIECQTDARIEAEVDVQTDDVDVRDITTTTDIDTQTDLVWVWNLQQSRDDTEVEPEPAPAAEQSLLDSSQESINAPDFDASMPEIPEAAADIDLDQGKYVQTDPVTIIIGDSTFLVDRLKTYARRQPAVRVVDTTRRKFGVKRENEDEGPPELMPAGNPGDPEDDAREMPVLAAEEAAQQAAHRVYAPKKKVHPGPRSTSKYTPPATPPQKYVPSFSHMKKPLEEKDLQPVSVKGRFDCPFCELFFGESAELYKHLQNTHGTPRASFRRSRRRGTIVITDEGESYVVGGGEAKPPKNPKKRKSVYDTAEGGLVQEIEVPYIEVPGAPGTKKKKVPTATLR